MMDVNAKYKRWGWGAIIGLVAVILVAGFVVAVTLSSNPKPNTDEVLVDNPDSGVIVGDADSNASDNKKSEEKKEENKASENKNSANTNNSQKNDVQENNVNNNVVATNNEMPQTGPENVLLSFFLIAVAAGLFAYNRQMIEARVNK